MVREPRDFLKDFNVPQSQAKAKQQSNKKPSNPLFSPSCSQMLLDLINVHECSSVHALYIDKSTHFSAKTDLTAKPELSRPPVVSDCPTRNPVSRTGEPTRPVTGLVDGGLGLADWTLA